MKPLPHGFVATPLDTAEGFLLSYRRHGTALSRAEMLSAMRDSPAAGASLGAALASLGYGGMYWECAVIGQSTLHKDFECVALRADHFAHKTVNSQAFADKFALARGDDQVVEFPNLGGKSVLVSPLPLDDIEIYGHIASFLKYASPSQIGAFFSQLSATALLRAQTSPVWVSTAGDAIAWLHGRIDNRPKYYHFEPYRAEFTEASTAKRLRF